MLFTKKRIIKIILLLTLTGITATTYAAFNPQINYQGKLTDANDVAVEDEDYNITFRLYTSPTSATTTNIWEEERIGADKITVNNGLFSVMLGEVTTLPDIFNQTLYLGVEVGGSGTPVWDGEMTPRKKLGAVPASLQSDKLDDLDSLQFLRSDTSDTMASTSASTLLTITQSGTGDILNLFDGATEVFTVLDGGNVGIGTTSPRASLDSPDIITSTLTLSPGTTLSSLYGHDSYLNLTNNLGIRSTPFAKVSTTLNPNIDLINIGTIQAGETHLRSGGTFAAKVDYGTGTEPYSVSIGDLNGDGKNDIAVANLSSNTVSVFINNGDGTFATKVDYGTGTTSPSVSIGDLNGDGKNDMAVANWSQHRFSLHKQRKRNIRHKS